MMCLVQIGLLFLTSFLFHIGVTNPNPTHSKDTVIDEGPIRILMIIIGPLLAKLLIWVSTAYQMIYLGVQLLPETFGTLLSSFVPTSVHNLLPLTPVVMLGFILMTIGGFGRLWCYRTLGNFFTYEITIQNSHQLIQNGPYAYVRHPSYSFAFILTLGMFFVHRRIASFLPNDPWVQMPFGPVGLCICCLIIFALLTRRVRREEAELKKKFDKQWTIYASTRKRFIPGFI